MHLNYLLFDFSDEEGGSCSFDAIASVLPSRLAPLIQEVEAVLAWACCAFGMPAAEDEGEWDFALQAVDDRDVPLEIGYDADRARVSLARVPAGRVTIALTLTGSRSFGEAFMQAFAQTE